MATLNINGNDVELEFDPDTPLLWVIREQAGLTGTKYAVSYTHLTLPTICSV